MANSKKISTYVVVDPKISTAPAVSVSSKYQDPNLGDVLEVRLNQDSMFINGQPLEEGEMVVVGTDNMPSDVDLEIDLNGNLLVFGDEADNYSIDSDGNLNYNKN